MNIVLRTMAGLALASCSAEPGGGNSVVPTQPVTEAETPMTNSNSLFRQDFRLAYGTVLWTMMVLRWCNARWDRPRETAELEERFAAIEAQAISRGLKPQMEQAAADNAQQMATMRLDTRCNGGFEPARARGERVLAELERFMSRRAEEAQAKDDSQAPPQDVHIAYLVVDANFFSLKACREPGILREVAVERARFENLEQRIARKLGQGALTSLRDHASMQSAVRMVEQCAGDRGMQRLRENLDRLVALLS